MTVNAGVRFDYPQGWIPAQQIPAGDFVPERTSPKVDDVLNWKDISPRPWVGMTFGNGRTAVKAFLGRYVTFQRTAV